MLHGGNHTCGFHPFTNSASKKDTVVGNKILRPKDIFPPVYCPLLMFLGPRKSLLLIGVLSSGFAAAI